MEASSLIISLVKENNGSWYVECKSWVEWQTALFRKTFMYIANDGKLQKYELRQDYSNPLDDHTKHPLWKNPREDLIMDESVVQMLEKCSKGRKCVRVVLSANSMSNSFIHLNLVDLTEKGAYYKDCLATNIKRYFFPPILRFIMHGYPENLYINVIE